MAMHSNRDTLGKYVGNSHPNTEKAADRFRNSGTIAGNMAARPRRNSQPHFRSLCMRGAAGARDWVAAEAYPPSCIVTHTCRHHCAAEQRATAASRPSRVSHTALNVEVVVIILLACLCPLAVGFGYGIAGRPVDEHGRLPSLRFMHIPKTGTSFILLLRNYLTACQLKDWTCPGDLGGFDADVRPPKNVSSATLSCNGRLIACDGRTYHAGLRPRVGFNWVTLLRHPLDRTMSGYFYVLAKQLRANETRTNVDAYMNHVTNIQVCCGGVVWEPAVGWKEGDGWRFWRLWLDVPSTSVCRGVGGPWQP